MPRERFERDERAVLLAPAAQPYHSLVLRRDARTDARPAVPSAERVVMTPRIVDVERRPLSVYAALTGTAIAGTAIAETPLSGGIQ